MKLIALNSEGREMCGIRIENRIIPIDVVNKSFDMGFDEDLLTLLTTGKFHALQGWYNEHIGALSDLPDSNALPSSDIVLSPLYRRPRKIWGIGLNYRNHAEDLSEKVPTGEPASFMKPDTSIIGYGDDILLPTLSERTTGEAELGLVIGKECKDVERKDWQTVVAGVTSIIDMTAEDILRRNPRNLTQSKSFDTFFSFGPMLATLDEFDDIFKTTVATVLNGRVQAENIPDNMTFPLDYLVSYHSRIMTLLPGDVISTGTPGAARLKHGDDIECRIEGLHPLKNTVKDLRH